MEFSESDTKEFLEWKLLREQALAAHEKHRADASQLFEATTQFALEAIRTATITNGGAVIAIFAFLGSTFNDTGPQIGAFRGALAVPALIFSLGAVFAGISSGFAYFAQHLYHEDHALVQYTWLHPFVSDLPDRKSFSRRGNAARVLSITLVGISYAAIFLGLCKSYELFTMFNGV